MKAYTALVWVVQTVDPGADHLPEARAGDTTVIAPFGVSGIWAPSGATVADPCRVSKPAVQ